MRNPFSPALSGPLSASEGQLLPGNPASLVAAVTDAAGLSRAITGTVTLAREGTILIQGQPLSHERGLFRYALSGAVLAQRGTYQYALTFRDENTGDVAYQTGSFEI